MSKQSLLLVDGDTRSLRVLEVSLRKAGFTVTPAASVKDALDKLELDVPDLIISETKFSTELDGFELRRRLRGAADWAEIPFVFLTAETAIENKIRGLELGVDDYLTKPIYIKEIVTRINILLQKRQRAYFDERKDGVRFAGRVADMPVVDVIQTIEVSRKSGVIQFVGDRRRQAAIYFRDGKVIDAEAGTLQGEDAVYRLLTWSEGEFEVVFRTVRRREAITTSSQGLLMEGMRRLDEWSRLLEQLPPLTHRFEIDTAELAIRLGDVPDDNNRILRLIDSKRSLLEVIDASDFGDLECLQAISRLYFEGMLVDLDPDQRPRRDTGKPVPLVMLESPPTPIEEVVSGPIDMTDIAARANEPLEPEAVALLAPEAALEAITDEQPVQPEPLMGSYRPSSLRLIDEAVAAAQAIEPSLFESLDDDLAIDAEPITAARSPTPVGRVALTPRVEDPRVSAARALVERTNGTVVDPASEPPRPRVKSVPPPPPGARRATFEAVAPIEISDEDVEAIPTEIAEPDSSAALDDDGEGTDPLRSPFAKLRQDDPGLRMIGSHGRDRAEASGELGPSSTPAQQSSGPQRELVTIMPRRTTREIPIVAPPVPAPPEAPAPEAPPPAPAIESPNLPPPRAAPVGGGVALQRSGPGFFAMTLLIAASILVGMTAYMYLRKTHPKPALAPAPADATESFVMIEEPADAHVLAVDSGAMRAVVDAGTRMAALDSGVAHSSADARVVAAVDAGMMRASGDARVTAADVSDGGIDRVRQARELADQAHSALEDGDFDKALALAESSLKFRKVARTYLERARALQRLDRIEDALASVDSALAMTANYAPAYEERALILWSARRYDEAKPAMEKYLELSPDGKSAPLFHRMLAEPR